MIIIAIVHNEVCDVKTLRLIYSIAYIVMFLFFFKLYRIILDQLTIPLLVLTVLQFLSFLMNPYFVRLYFYCQSFDGGRTGSCYVKRSYDLDQTSILTINSIYKGLSQLQTV
jgi:hypothetical protein